MSDLAGDAFRWVAYRVLGRLINRPSLLAFLVRAAQLMGVTVAWRHAELDKVCRRPNDFSNRAHAPQLIAGDFVIGMDSGPRQRLERDAATCPLPTPDDFGMLAAEEAGRRLRLIRKQMASSGRFDLIGDYLAFVVWNALGASFDPASIASIENNHAGAPADDARRILFRELRYIGANLVVAGASPRSVHNVASACAAALNQRVSRSIGLIKHDWNARCPLVGKSAHRQAVGLMWVGHPATVQAGAFVFQELRQRPAIYASLRDEVQRYRGDKVFADTDIRRVVRAHVLECLRLRPTFPLLPRLLFREARVLLGEKPREVLLKAGTSIPMAIVAALRDPAIVEKPDQFLPGRTLALWKNPDNLPIFGDGERACIARNHVLECLVSALIGLLLLPELDWADRMWGRIVYEGPVITRMRLRQARGERGT